MGDVPLDDVEDRVAIVKVEQNRSPTYHPATVYADDVYMSATHLNAEHLDNDYVRQRQYDVTRQYQWMLNKTGDHVTNCGRYSTDYILTYSDV